MKIHILLLLQLLTLGAFAQKGFKLSAYQQEVSGGASQIFADPNGNTVSSKQKQVNYLFYMELTGEKIPEIKEIWINGLLYDAKLKDASSPVTIHQKMSIEKNPVPDTLVATTTNKIVQVIPVLSPNPEKKTKKASKANEVCIIYMYNGKKYKTAKSIHSLKGIANQ